LRSSTDDSTPASKSTGWMPDSAPPGFPRPDAVRTTSTITAVFMVLLLVVRRLLRCHAQCPVHANGLTVEVIVFGDHDDELRILPWAPEPLRKRNPRREARIHLGPQLRQQRRVDDARCDR